MWSRLEGWQRLLFLLLLAGGLLWLGWQATSVPFISVSQHASLGRPPDAWGTPTAHVINNPQEMYALLQPMERSMPPEAFEQRLDMLQAVDYQQSVAILVQAGNLEVEVTQAHRLGNRLYLQVVLDEMQKGGIGLPMSADPYHLIAIPRSELPPSIEVEVWEGWRRLR